ncbi:MAG: bifunctional lysylphosphatidylglycerol synthetase/lysine--tRNA ligase LysX [Nocardiaceae bacterium]|nr:bifunctional lysylphosphatidylglycerol synthetase/lysine--tRNA ligase LysX [Nocardiaceae bacterium]
MIETASVRRRIVPRLTGLVVGCAAIACAIWSVVPVLRERSEPVRSVLNSHFIHAPNSSLSWALALGVLAVGLWRAKRVAWWALIVMAVVVAGGHAIVMTQQVDLDSGIAFGISAGVLAILVALQPQFPQHSRWPSVGKTIAAVIAFGLVFTAIGYGIIALAPGRLAAQDQLWYAANRVVMFGLLPNSYDTGVVTIGVDTALGALGAAAFLAVLAVVRLTQRTSNTLTEVDESAIQALIARSDVNDSLAYFSTRRDNSVVFAPSGKAAVAYRTGVGVSMAVGDPVGNQEAWPHAIEAWLEMCRNHNWIPAATGASKLGARAYRRAGLSTLRVASEAILNPTEFDLSAPEFKAIRLAGNRLRKQGLTVRVRRQADIAAAELAAVHKRAAQWADTHTERGFHRSLGRIGEPSDTESLLVEAVGPGGPVAMMSLVPWGATGATVDLLCRDESAPGGITELMMSELVLASAALGLTRISFGFTDVDNTATSGMARIPLFLSRWWQQDSSRAANEQYRPKWVPRYVAYPAGRVSRVSIASGVIEGRRRAASTFTSGRTRIDRSILADLLESPIPQPLPVLSRQPQRPEHVRVRIDKLARLAEAGIPGYPPAYQPTHTIAAARDAVSGTRVRLTGRLLAWRDLGGLGFAKLRDATGDIQVMVDANRCGEDKAATFGSMFDLGDLIEVSGPIGRARKAEISLFAMDWRLVTKSLHPLPDRHKGLVSPEAKVRQRHVELATNPSAREVARARSVVLHSIRSSLAGWDYLEAETPILQSNSNGLNARSFRTQADVFGLELRLRTTPALQLKQLAIGGLERVYELGRSFADSGTSAQHNPEFTTLHAFEAHIGYGEMVTRCQEMVQQAALAVHGQALSFRQRYDGVMRPFDIGGPWPVRTFYEAVSEAAGQPVNAGTTISTLRIMCETAGITPRHTWDEGRLAYALYERLVVARTELPTFYRDFPVTMAPMARALATDEDLAERCDLVAWGSILGSVHTELTDPLEQRRRLALEESRALAGDVDAIRANDAYLEALEFGMLPTAGLWLDVDRVITLITGRTVRESLAFPFVKPLASR